MSRAKAEGVVRIGGVAGGSMRKSIAVAALMDKSVTYTPTNEQQTDEITPDERFDGLSKVNVTVEAMPEGSLGQQVDTRTKKINMLDVKITYPNIVPGYFDEIESGALFLMQNETVTPSKSEQVVTPTHYMKYLESVTVEPIPEEYIIPAGKKTVTENGTGIDIAEYAELDVAVPGTSPTLQTVSKTYTPTTSQQTESITPSSGYDGLDEVDITVNAMPTGSLGQASVTREKKINMLDVSITYPNMTPGYFDDFEAGALFVMQNETVTPSSVQQVITPDNYMKYLESVTVEPAPAPATQSLEKVYTPTESQQYENIRPDSGYLLDQVEVTVNAISPNYVGSNITRRDSTDLEVSGATLEVPAGYYEQYANKSVASGALAGMALTLYDNSNMQLSVSNSGLVSAYYYNQNITMAPVTTAGYIDTSATTGGYVNIEKTLQLTTQAATTVTPTTSQQTVGAAGRYMLGAVTVEAVQQGTAGTPTATKSAVNNHSLTVTPSVTNTTGHITGGTKTGTAVSVSASELVSGSETKTANGTYDVTNLAEIVVDVSGGGGSTAQMGYTDTTLSTAASSITFTGLSGEPTSFIVGCCDDLATGSSPFKVAAVVYDGSSHHGQTITNTSNAQVTYDGSSFSHTYNNGTLTVSSTGAYFQAATYTLDYSYGGTAANIQTVDVQVGSGATSITFTGIDDVPLFYSVIFKGNFSTSSGYQRTIWVLDRWDGEGGFGMAMDSSAHFLGSWSSNTSTPGELLVSSSGTNSGGYFHQPGYYQLTAVYASASPYEKVTKTYTPSTSQQTDTITPSTGYDAIDRVNVTIEEMPSMTLPSATSGTSSGTSKATITPTSSAQYLNIPTGYNATAQYYTIGASGGGGTLTVATKTITQTAVSQTLSFTSLSGQPKYWFCRCTSNVSSSGSTTYYYVTDCFYDGTSVTGNTFRIGSTRRVQNVTSGITQSYSGGTLTITAGSASTATPGQFYGASGIGYELIYIY